MNQNQHHNPSNDKQHDKYTILKQYFGYDAFREGQEELIDRMLSGQDVLGIMPTGAGKSICYQVPALLLDGITVVISPLISLMKDQVSSLNQAGVHAAYINSSLTENQIAKAFDNAEKGTYKIIYIAPERLDTPRFLHFVENARISLVAVDEAHCVSQWGQDFRPGYLNIAPFVEKLKKRPVMCAFTATATKEVKEDILCILGLSNPYVKVTGFDRKNLYFAVKHAKDKKAETLRYVSEHGNQCGIIYCSTRNSVEEVCEMLCANGIAAAKYHAGMGNAERAANQEDFIYDVKTVMVATNAFGMGIDKSNVRYVLHYNMPQSMENYYQEAGRAGRDGENAECMLLYGPKDVVTNRLLIENKESKKELTREETEAIRERDMKRLRDMTYYCATKDCLRNYILKYFGENVHGECGNCSNCLTDYEQHDITELARKIVNCVYEIRQRFGINIVVGILRGSKAERILSNHFDKLKTYGTLTEYAESTLRQVIDTLIWENILYQTDDDYPILKLGSDYLRLKDNDAHICMKSEIRHAKNTKTVSKSLSGKNTTLSRSNLTDTQYQCFEKLRALRTEIAREEHVPPYIVFSDKTLVDMCIRLPKTLQEMLNVNGVGENKLEKYGERFLEVLQNQ
ncbi:MAG: DNA helicase RecQ [Thermoflexaceae bacterium]|nr:DNA helicase RecQ [Thermoflexaceae bacterium]